MADKFRFSTYQRLQHNLPGEISLDFMGNEILAGLSLDETKECLAIKRHGPKDEAQRKRYNALAQRSWAYWKASIKNEDAASPAPAP